MKTDITNFLAVYSIVCPYCKFKQTGIVRTYEIITGEQLTDEELMQPFRNSHPGIRCCMAKLNGVEHCGKLITGDLLEEVTRTAVKSPSNFNF